MGVRALRSDPARRLVFVSPNFSGGTGPYDLTLAQPGTLDGSGSATGGFNSSGSAAAHVDGGVIELSGDSSGSLNSTACRIFRDSLTITAPGVAAGTIGTLTYSILVQGSLVADNVNANDARWQLQADLGGGAFDINRSATFYKDNPVFAVHGYIGDPFGSYSATITFQFGFAMPLDVELTGIAQTSCQGNPNPGSSSFDLSHSLYWGGISGVSIGGQAVSSFSVSAESGTGYVNSAVAEPACALMLGGGALALLGWRRRRLSRHP
jgi:hypothetical protein